jgi:MOSC domain-containing protein YiiM
MGSVIEVSVDSGREGELVASLRACLASVLEVPLASVPVPRTEDAVLGAGQWLAEHGLALVRAADPGAFRLAGHWIARLAPTGSPGRFVVMFGVPSGVVWDPLGTEVGGDLTVSEALVLVGLDSPGLQAPPLEPGSGVVRGLYVAASAGAPMVSHGEVLARAGRGLEGDRYAAAAGTFSVAGGVGNDITLVTEEALAAAILPDGRHVTASESRRNVVVAGVDLDALIGREFRIGEVRLVGRRRCEPCAHLERLTAPGVLRALVHRGGLRADVLSDGRIATGDPLEEMP